LTSTINEVAAVPHICKIAPAGTHHMEDPYHAGSIQAVMNRLIAGLRTVGLSPSPAAPPARRGGRGSSTTASSAH
jgi:hypothetical protein